MRGSLLQKDFIKMVAFMQEKVFRADRPTDKDMEYAVSDS